MILSIDKGMRVCYTVCRENKRRVQGDGEREKERAMKRSLEERASEVTVTMMRGWLKATSGNGWHTIKFAKNDGVPYCTCAAWRFQKVHPRLRWCKHLERAKQLGLIKKLAEQGEYPAR